MTNLTCLWARPRVERHVDGALGLRAARRVEAHLGTCRHCLARAESFRRLRALVSAAADPVEPDWSTFWSGVRVGMARAKPVPLRDAWWLPFWRPFWGHPRLTFGGALAAGLVGTLLLWSAPEPALSGSVIVQDVSTSDPDRSVMVYSMPDEAVTVIWLFSSDGSSDES